MAPCRSQYIIEVVVVVAVMMLAGAAQEGTAECPTPANKLVYPYTGRCGVYGAARYHGEELYELGVTSLIGTIAGSLAPEWDETTSTFYVRSADVGAKYLFGYLQDTPRRNRVAQSDDVAIINYETMGLLGWKQEDEGEWFLVEMFTVDNDTLRAGIFQFSRAPFSSSSRCNFVDPRITCEAYHMLDFGTSLGLNPYWENGVTYFMLSAVSNSTSSARFEQNSFQLLRHNRSSAVSSVHGHHDHLRSTAAAAAAAM